MTNHTQHFAVIHDFLRDDWTLFWISAIILGNQFNRVFFTIDFHPAFGVDFLNGQTRAAVVVFTCRGRTAGQRCDAGQINHVFAAGRAAAFITRAQTAHQRDRQNGNKADFLIHVRLLLSIEIWMMRATVYWCDQYSRIIAIYTEIENLFEI